jgi:hypothetical protein
MELLYAILLISPVVNGPTLFNVFEPETINDPVIITPVGVAVNEPIKEAEPLKYEAVAAVSAVKAYDAVGGVPPPSEMDSLK